MQTEGITRLKTELIVNDTVIPLNRFTQDFIGNVVLSISTTLGFRAKKVSLTIATGNIRIVADDSEVPINKDFVRRIVESTIYGAISPLKGVFWLGNIRITTEE